MGEIIVVASGKGGAGKTSATANIGVGLAELGKKVLMIDTDLGLRNLDIVMGLENKVVYNLVDVINGRCPLDQALIGVQQSERLFLLPAAQSKDKSAISPQQMKQLTSNLKEEYDYILLDCPSGIDQGFRNGISGAERAIVLTTPEAASVRNTDKIIDLLKHGGIMNVSLLVNKVRMDMIKKGDMMSLEDVTEILSADLLGIVPDDDAFLSAYNHGQTVVGLEALSGQAYRNICQRLIGEEIPFLNLEKACGLLYRLSNAFRKN